MRDFELPGKGARPRTVDGYEKTIRRLMGDWCDVPLRCFADKPHLVTAWSKVISFNREYRRNTGMGEGDLPAGLPSSPRCPTGCAASFIFSRFCRACVPTR